VDVGVEPYPGVVTRTGVDLAQVRRIPVDQVNTGPKTESWIRYEKQVVALALIRGLLERHAIEGVVMQHSSDVIMLYRDRRPKLVSIKHREPTRSKGDSGWGPSDLADAHVLDGLFRQWTEAEEWCQPAFWSNAGFVKEARKFHADNLAGVGPSTSFVDWMARRAKLPAADVRRFLADLELLADPLPRRGEIGASGAQSVAQFLTDRGRSATPLFAQECFEVLCARIIELSADRPAAPADDSRRSLVDRLFPQLDSRDAAALANRLLPVEEAEAILLSEHDRRTAQNLPQVGFRWEADDRFVGREQVLTELASLLAPGGVTPVAPVAIRGMPGCGKTSVATQFAARFSDAMQPVFVSANSRADVVAALQHLGGHQVDFDASGITAARTPVAPVLPTTSRTLLIIDGVSDPDVVRGLIPRRSLCRVLITTTVANLDSGYKELYLQPWEPDESRTFLEGFLREEAAEAIDRLREELHDHPLALNQAVDNCIVTGRGIDDYIARLRDAPAETLQLGQASGHPISVIESIRLNIELVEAIDPESTLLLTMLSYLGPAPIHESLFDRPIVIGTVETPTPTDNSRRQRRRARKSRARRHTRARAADKAEDPSLFTKARDIRRKLRDRSFRDRATEQLARMSLISARSGRLSVHPLIALVVCSHVTDIRPWLGAGIGMFLPDEGQPMTAPASGLDANLGAAAHIASIAIDHGFTGPAVIVVCGLLSQRLALVGPSQSATSKGWNAIDFGHRGIDAATDAASLTQERVWLVLASQIRFWLVQAYSLDGQVENALDAIRENIIVGHDIGLVEVIVENIAAAEAVASIHGRRDIAEHLLDRTRELLEINLKPDHRVLTLITRANVLRMLNRTEDASASIEQAMDIILSRKADLSPSLVAKAHASASIIAKDSGDSIRSLRSEMEILDIQHSSATQIHISPLDRIQHLQRSADAAICANRLDLAEGLLHEAEELATLNKYGPESMPYTDILSIRGRLSMHKGQFEEARADLENAIATLRKLPASFRPRLPPPLVHLAHILWRQADFETAIARASEAYAIDLEIYGFDHPETQKDLAILNDYKDKRPR
jgi:tetratricopeptide (TPR) repeat protein